MERGVGLAEKFLGALYCWAGYSARVAFYTPSVVSVVLDSWFQRYNNSLCSSPILGGSY